MMLTQLYGLDLHTTPFTKVFSSERKPEGNHKARGKGTVLFHPVRGKYSSLVHMKAMLGVAQGH